MDDPRGRPSRPEARSVQSREPSARVRALVRRYELPAATTERLLRLVRLLEQSPLAPTALRDPLAAIDDHLADSLVALELEPVRSASAVADLGAGAGFPGLPLAIALPMAEVALVDGNARKCTFVQSAVAACEVFNARAVNARAEEWLDGLRAFDLVSARALASLPVVAEYAAPLLRMGGALVVWRGRRDREAEAAGSRAAHELGLEPGGPVHVRPYPGAEHRHLHLMVKVGETPARFPRRSGMARKRPLGRPSIGVAGERSSDRSRR
ncbi:MAG: 16S rRNA (guanine(527)-N(7))-methyltransferase RsmG [Solirubrobacteraceae bacterium]